MQISSISVFHPFSRCLTGKLKIIKKNNDNCRREHAHCKHRDKASFNLLLMHYCFFFSGIVTSFLVIKMMRIIYLI